MFEKRFWITFYVHKNNGKIFEKKFQVDQWSKRFIIWPKVNFFQNKYAFPKTISISNFDKIVFCQKFIFFLNWIFVLWFLIWVSFGNFYEIEPEYTLKHENILTIFDQWLTTLNQWSTTFDHFFTTFHAFQQIFTL